MKKKKFNWKIKYRTLDTMQAILALVVGVMAIYLAVSGDHELNSPAMIVFTCVSVLFCALAVILHFWRKKNKRETGTSIPYDDEGGKPKSRSKSYMVYLVLALVFLIFALVYSVVKVLL